MPGEAGARQWVLSGRNRNTTAATLLVSNEKEEQVKERGPCEGIPFLERGFLGIIRHQALNVKLSLDLRNYGMAKRQI